MFSVSFAVNLFLQLKIFTTQHKAVAQILFTHNLILGQLFRCTLEKNLSFEQQVGAVGDTKGFLYVVVGNQDTNILVLQFPHDLLNVFYGNRVDTGKRL